MHHALEYGTGMVPQVSLVEYRWHRYDLSLYFRLLIARRLSDALADTLHRAKQGLSADFGLNRTRMEETGSERLGS